MTLKSLFFKLQKEDLKRRIWSIALSVLVFFICLPIYCALSIENYNANLAVNLDKKQIFNEILNFMGPQNELIITMTIICAIVCGLSGFFYLHSRKKVDFYHSMPVRREILFIIKYMNGLLIYLIPYIINVILCIIILQVNHYMNIEVFAITISAIGINLLFYSLIYTIVIIAVMLTGNIVISFMGSAVFLLYGIMLMGVRDMYFTEFFTNFYSRDSKTMEWISPIIMYINIANQISFSTNYALLGKIFGVLIVTLLLIGFAIFLYKKRPSEAATKAMAFKYSRPVIKFFIVIPVSLMGGLIFKQISNSGSNGWFIFGLIFSLIISYAIIEIIYHFDIRSAFYSKKQLLICAGIIAGVVCIFQFDLFHYDSYIPKKSSIESMSVAISGLDDNIQYYQPGGNNLSSRNKYMDGVRYQLNYMKLTDFEPAYDLAKIGIEQTDQSLNNDGQDIYYTYNVKYSLNSGREVYRTYRFRIGENTELLKDIYESPAFKEVHYPIYKIKAEAIGSIYCQNMFGSKKISLNSNEKIQLLDIYKEELSNMTLDVASDNYPISTFTISINDYYSIENYVYPTFEKTISFLKAHGFDATQKLDVKDINKIIISNQSYLKDPNYMNYQKEYATYSMDKTYANNSAAAEYTNQEEIEAILPNLVQSDYYWNNRTIYNMNTEIEVNIFFDVDVFGNESNSYFFFKNGKIPDFVMEDIKYTQE